MDAVRIISSGAGKACQRTVHLRCHVKPGVSKQREGVTAVTEDAVEVCIAARAQDGEANKALVRVLSQVLKVTKSSVHISRGLKSRDKTVVIGGWTLDVDGGENSEQARITKLLSRALTP